MFKYNLNNFRTLTHKVMQFLISSRFKSDKINNNVSILIDKRINSLLKYVKILNNKLSFLQTEKNKCNQDNIEQTNIIKLTDQIFVKSPNYVQPYLKMIRINRPGGTWLVFWPCTWGITLASDPGNLPDLYLLTLFGLGSIIMRGVGCTINDMIDKDLDSKVARTFDRPLVNGSMTMKQAWIFLACQLSAALTILLQLNWFSVLLGASSLGLVAVYPLMKRITHWPQIILGLTINWGILLGYSAVQGTLNMSICIPMYVSGICWTLIYDTIYAHQDIADDMLHGIKSTAVLFKENTKYWLYGFFTTMFGNLTYCGFMTEQTWLFYSALFVSAARLAWQISSVNIDNPKDCGNTFLTAHRLGFIIFMGLLMGNLYKNKNHQKENIL